MILGKLLDEFYLKNGIPENGGNDQDTFEMKVFSLKLILPNPQFRKDVTHIHDIQHILNDCDTSWKGEGFVSGWEIATGIWKYFPICIFSFWAMGYSLWMHPRSVFSGFKKGLNSNGIIDLRFSISEFREMEFDRLFELTKKDQMIEMGIVQWGAFLFWSIISQAVFLFPFILGIIGLIWIFTS